MNHVTLQEVIRQYVPLPPRANARGWFPVVCRVCNDHNKKGPRAGFKFDRHIVGYNCFNCAHSAVYDPTENKNLSKDMIDVLDAFGVPETEWNKVVLDALINEYTQLDREHLIVEPTELSLPRFFYPLTNDRNDEWCQYAIEYLNARGIDWTTYPFYCVSRDNHPDNKRWYGRLIIPTYKDNKLIFYQGRDLTELHPRKYLSASTPREAILYGYDKLLVNTSEPLYVVEGWFDAYAIGGVAVFGNKITRQQLMLLNRSNRPKVIIPDRFGDGHLLAKQAISLGWKISTLDINDSCKDVSESITKHGLLYTTKTIVDNIVEGNHAEVIINLYCKGRTR